MIRLGARPPSALECTQTPNSSAPSRGEGVFPRGWGLEATPTAGAQGSKPAVAGSGKLSRAAEL